MTMLGQFVDFCLVEVIVCYVRDTVTVLGRMMGPNLRISHIQPLDTIGLKS